MTPGPPRLTRRGAGVLAAAAALLLAARLFGAGELAGLSVAAAGAVGAAAVLVRRAPMTYRAERWLAPARVGVGDPAHARLRFANTGRAAATRPAEAVDRSGGNGSGDNGSNGGGSGGDGPDGGGSDGGGSGGDGPDGGGSDGCGQRCFVPALAPGAVAEARYDLPTGRRGAFAVGPLAVSVSDALGLVERRLEVAGPARLVVHPRVHSVLALPGTPTREARHGTTAPARSPQGDDFFALREYVVGDDIRRVHWRSTARAGDLMLRQDELRFGEVATVLLDTRAGTHRGGSFERALEVAASVAAALVEDGRRFRFVTTGGFDVEVDRARAGAARGRAEGKWGAILDHLALVTPDAVTPHSGAGADGRFALTVQSIRRRPSGPLAAVVAGADGAELAALGALRSRLGLVMIARCAAAGDGADGAAPAPGAVVVPAGPQHDFVAAWNTAVLARGRREVVRR